MERLSPELILVDPDLARRARRELPEPRDCLARSSRPTSTVDAGLVGPTPATEPSGGAPRRVVPSLAPRPRPGDETRSLPSFRVVVGALLVAVLVGSPAVELLRSGSANPPLIGAQDEPPARTTSADESEVPADPLSIRLEWPKVRGADFYDVVLWRDGRRVTDLWPRTNGVEIAREPSLRPGTYQWFAFPAFTEGGSTRYGRSVARGEFRLT